MKNYDGDRIPTRSDGNGKVLINFMLNLSSPR
jgi:hypothetical protein